MPKRWRGGGTRPTDCSDPETFLPPLTAAGYLDELSWIMLALAALEAGRWRAAGLHLSVSVNVSATSLADPSYADAVTQIVSGQGLEPAEMILELTESEAIRNVAAALENLTRLRMNGFGLAIDDYGVGYSSMQELSRMPFTEVKIDRSFVMAATGQRKASDDDRAHGRGRAAPGAQGPSPRASKRAAERDLLASLGCDMIQGFLIAEPMDGKDFLRWMMARRANVGAEPRGTPDAASALRHLSVGGVADPTRRGNNEASKRVARAGAERLPRQRKSDRGIVACEAYGQSPLRRSMGGMR